MIDPSIALQVRPPEIPDMSEGIVRGMQLKGMQQQQQAGALDLQQKQIEMQDQATMRQAYMDSGGDMGKFQQLLMTRGVSPKAITQVQQQILATQESHAKLTDTQLQNQQKQVQAIGSVAQGLLNQPDEQTRAGQWGSARQAMLQIPGVTPDQVPTQYPGQQWVTDHRNGAITAQQYAENEQKNRTVGAEETTAAARALTAKTSADKLTAELPGVTADAQAKARQNVIAQLTTAPTPAAYNQILNDAKVPHGALPSAQQVFDATGKPIPTAMASLRQLGMTPDQQAVTGQAAANAAQTAAHNKVEEQQGAGRLSVEQGRLGIENKKFNATIGAGLDANGQPVQPVMGPDGKPAVNPTAAAIAGYQIPPPSPRTLASPAGQNLLRQVLAVNPSFDATQFPKRNKITQDFSASGASGKAITSTDTALAHLNTISTAGQAMKSGDVQMLNRLANSLGAQVGQSPQITYDAIVQTVAPEVSKAVIGGTGGEADRAKMAANFSSNLSDAQREGAIGATAQLLGARYHKMAQGYEADMGKPLERQLSPESQGVLGRYSPAPARGPVQPLQGGQAGALPQGGGKLIDKATVQQFYQAAGNDPVKARALAVQNGWKVQ